MRSKKGSRMMMNDLISRSALLEMIADNYANAACYDQCTRAMLEEHCDYAKGLVNEAPAVDAAPVKHGRWIEHDSCDYELECGCCRARFDGEMWYAQDGYRGNPKFCPNCGAKMDEEADPDDYSPV